jgi:putative FmdB family regulatory protein
MPRYFYECAACGHSGVFIHRMNETIEVCEKCEQKTMLKGFKNSFTLNKKNSPPTSQKVGEVTKTHIQDNKDILKQQQEEAKEQTYEPS